MAEARSTQKLVTKKIITLTFGKGDVEQIIVREDLGDKFDTADEHFTLSQPRLRRFTVWRIDMVRSCDDRTIEVPDTDLLTDEEKQAQTRNRYDFELK